MQCEYLDSTLPDKCVYEFTQGMVRKFVDVVGEVKYQIDSDTELGHEQTGRNIDYKEVINEVFNESIKPFADIKPCQNCTIYNYTQKS
jgi:hypothetical protein